MGITVKSRGPDGNNVGVFWKSHADSVPPVTPSTRDLVDRQIIMAKEKKKYIIHF
jgi:hypothetical protein